MVTADLRAFLAANCVAAADVRADGHELVARVQRALETLGVRATCRRIGPAIVEVDLPPSWPSAWSLAEVLPGACDWTVRAHQQGRVVRVRRVRPLGTAHYAPRPHGTPPESAP